jgi:hypothetical protein
VKLPLADTSVTMTANEFFNSMRDQASDRSSALIEYCRRKKIRWKRTIDDRQLSGEDMDELVRIFGRKNRIPKALLEDGSWDT